MSNLTTEQKSQGARFLDAYNALDRSLRVQYNFKATISFTDLIRRCADLNHVIRKFENDLINFARLRNAIIHHKDSSQVIAEPHIDVVNFMEKVARLIGTPPLVVDIFKARVVLTIDATRKMYDLIKETGKSGYGVIPAYKGNNLVGVVRWRKLIEDLSNSIVDNKSVDEFIRNTSIEDYLRMYPHTGHFAVVSANVTIEEVLTIFNNNRKIAAILITHSGLASERPIGIVTNADIIDLIKIIENY